MTKGKRSGNGGLEARNPSSDHAGASDDATVSMPVAGASGETPAGLEDGGASLAGDPADELPADELPADVTPEILAEEFEVELEDAEQRIEHKGPGAFKRLYRGGTSFDFIGNRRWWFAISALVILAGVISMGTRGLNEGIDFKGGTSWTVTSNTLTVAQATAAAKAAGVVNPTVIQLTNLSTHQRQVEIQADLTGESAAKHTSTVDGVSTGLAKSAGVSAASVSINDVGPTWGGQVTHKAIEALIIFFIVVAIYISIRFEYKMAIAAIVAVLHDLLVTAGIYSLAGFQVTPDTVVAVLTVLGYSLYDTVVVFDRIGENAKGLGASGRITYSDMVNLSMNQTLARSINTSLVAIMPVLSVLVVGSLILGATTLQDFGLALVIGLTSGAYSSIFIASPLLALMKEREPRYTTIRQRLETRGDRLGILTPSAAAAMVGVSAGPGGGRGGRARVGATGVVRPGAATANTARTATKSAGQTRAGVAAGARSRSGAGATSGSPRQTQTQTEAQGLSRGPGPGPSAGSTSVRPAPRPRKGKGKSKGKRR